MPKNTEDFTLSPAEPTPDGPPAKKCKISQYDRFRMKCGYLSEFTTLRGRPPKKQSEKYENDLATFIDNCRQRQLQMKQARIDMLNSIHTGILTHIKSSHRCSQPSLAWMDRFKQFAHDTTAIFVRSAIFPSTRESYVLSSLSFPEHVIKKSGCHLKFEPSDCDPGRTLPGTMEDVLSYALFP